MIKFSGIVKERKLKEREKKHSRHRSVFVCMHGWVLYLYCFVVQIWKHFFTW